MAFDTPDLRKLIENAQADIEAELPGANARLRRSNLNVLARVMAGVVHPVYAFVREFLSQCLPWSKGFLLRMWAELWGVYPQPAVSAQGAVVFTGVDGSPIDAGTRLQYADGREYITAADAVIAGGIATVEVQALVPGIAGNLAGGTKLNLVTTVDGVNDEATVGADGLTGGTEAETIDAFYDRYLQRVQNPPGGGNDEDYERWAREVPGVTRVWVRGGLDGVDTVQVFFVRDNDVPSIFPDAPEVAAVLDYIKAPGRKPVAATVGVYAPVRRAIDFTLSAVPDTAEVRAAITNELRDLIRRESELGGTILLSHMDEAISLAEGETDHTLIEPSASVVCAPNELADLGNIAWVV